MKKMVFVVMICLLVLSAIYGYNALLVNKFEEGTEIEIHRESPLSINPGRIVYLMADPIGNPHPH